MLYFRVTHYDSRICCIQFSNRLFDRSEKSLGLLKRFDVVDDGLKVVDGMDLIPLGMSGPVSGFQVVSVRQPKFRSSVLFLNSAV